ncbi:MAG: aryl-sulfate sulfotransferase [Ignavibacteriaceae bacterium]|nr:aryl-sulfate sulfotransferase [Ignavibacteriaceae bacterium]
MQNNLYYRSKTISYLFVLYFLIIVPLVKIFSQPGIRENYQYLSPLPNAVLVQPETDIIIRQGNDINPSTLSDKFIEINGSRSGIHRGKLILSDDRKTVIFIPDTPFSLGEIVKVLIKKGIRNQNGNFLVPIKYQFRIIEKKVSVKRNYAASSLFPELINKPKRNITNGRINTDISNKIKFEKSGFDSLPPDFPVIDLMINDNPSPGEFFIAPFQFTATTQFGYLMILENDGLPVYYKRFNYVQLDFKLQKNGNLTYFSGSSGKYYEMNNFYSIVDSFTCGNGYQTDMHELIILSNGHALIIADDYQYVRMDTIVAGGDSNAVVEGNIIQELDQDKNVVFQWRSWDHYQITDATPDIDLTAALIDYVHCNAVEEDSDGNLLISCRHMDEVTKIDRQTGDIIWRLGGVHCKNNQFTFFNDSTGFSHQHDIRRIPNGNITLFDNGNLHSPLYSRACEYQLDEINKTATLVWQYQNDPITYNTAMGSVQRLPEENTLIGWGFNNGPPGVSEIHPDNSKAWAISLPENVYTYRAFKYFWRTNFLVTDPDSISFLNVQVGNSDTANFIVTNNSDSTLLINDIYSSDSSFSLLQTPPFQIPSHSNINLTVKFEPAIEGEVEGWLHLASNRYTELIAQTIFVRGTTDSVFSYVDIQYITDEFKLSQNYPNPFNPSTNIKYHIPTAGMVSLKVYDILGREVATLVNEEKPAGSYEVEFSATALSSGIYFYRLTDGNFIQTNKMVLMK